MSGIRRSSAIRSGSCSAYRAATWPGLVVVPMFVYPARPRTRSMSRMFASWSSTIRIRALVRGSLARMVEPPLRQGLVDHLDQSPNVDRLGPVRAGPRPQELPAPVLGGVGADHHDGDVHGPHVVTEPPQHLRAGDVWQVQIQ